jgi:hypothetical protein
LRRRDFERGFEERDLALDIGIGPALGAACVAAGVAVCASAAGVAKATAAMRLKAMTGMVRGLACVRFMAILRAVTVARRAGRCSRRAASGPLQG